MTTDPHYTPYIMPATSMENLEDIEYPNISDIQMKDNFQISNNRPIIDRSSKGAAEKTYSWSKTELLDEKELLLEKSIKTAQAALEAENTYKEVCYQFQCILSFFFY